ncbi:hypothetical protein [Micromonospora humi]|uniref:Transmembrane protein n=1 Tax=Micromonospora humi TaxID=745366 RepID=A0A1C5K9X0_9ACTN|nr:hypothetical protein [Micromonospora humi]SCG79421.1 hypothetical protein GA0070213_12716 [Micromonospora humi]
MAANDRLAPLVRLGQPGPYVIFMIIAALGWLPLRLWDERDGSALVAVVRAGLGGVIWGAFPFLLSLGGRMGRKRRTAAEAERAVGWRVTEVALRSGEPPADEAGRAAVVDDLPAVRRGALGGAAVGTLFLGALAALAVAVGWTASAIGFGVVLVVVLAVAARTARRERRLRAAVQAG